MRILSSIEDLNSGKIARISPNNELIISPSYRTRTKRIELTSINTVYNVAKPRTGKTIRITGMIVSGYKSIDPNVGALVNIYSADTIDGRETPASLVFTVQRLTTIPIMFALGTGLDIGYGKFLNVETDDATVSITFLYHYYPEKIEEIL